MKTVEPKKLPEMVKEMIALADQNDHSSVWCVTDKTSIGGKVLVFITWDDARAKRAEQALREAGCLDGETIGVVGEP